MKLSHFLCYHQTIDIIIHCFCELQEAVEVFKTALERKPDHYPAHSLYNMYGTYFIYTVELQWLEHLWSHETGVVRVNEC